MTATTLDDAVRQAAAQRPDALALVDAANRESFFAGSPLRLSWSDLDNAVGNLALSLKDLGVEFGTPVAVQLPNVAELVLTVLACNRLGAVVVPFPIQHRSHELRYGCATAAVEVMVTGIWHDRPDQLETVDSVVAELGGGVKLATFGAPDHESSVSLSISTEPVTVDPVVQANDRATVCWTSGTTGDPKGVPRSSAMWLASGQFQVDELDLGPDDCLLCPFPIVNMAGIGGMVVPWIIVGATFVLHQPLDLQVFLGQIASEGVTYTVAPPPLLNMLLHNEALLESVDLSSIRKIASGSAPLDPWMVEGWDARGIEIVNVFGSNEGAAMLTTKASVPDPTNRARFFPRPSSHGVVVRLVDLKTGEDITGPGQPGELRFSGPTVFDGYIGSTGDEFDEQGYYRTGDIFEWVAESSDPQLLRFVDRAKDIIIRGGMNISAAEVEGLVSSHESVAECAAIGYPDPTLGERLGVFVVAAPDGDPTLESIVEHMREQKIASYKLPERLELVDTLPRNPVGKVTKTDLRARWDS